MALTIALPIPPADSKESAKIDPVRPTPRSSRFRDFVALTKPRIAMMVLITVFTGFYLGARGASNPSTLLLTMAGTGLVACGASVMNQVLEKDRDKLMRRTVNRPLPAGRVGSIEATVFGCLITSAGLLMLALGVNGLSAVVAVATWLLYVFVYTPLKPLTTLNTAIGAIPGALPPVIGWAAATDRLGVEAWSLFLIGFLWQFPHFLAIAWVHREDYARGGFRMLPLVDPTGAITGRQAAFHALALIPAGLLPTAIGLAGNVYFIGAMILGIYYLIDSIKFWMNISDQSARKLMRASFLYLPAIVLLLLLNPLPA